MGAVIGVIVLATLFLILSVFLFQGKGSWLIAGYNTASEEEKAKYDKKKLCKGVSGITLITSVMLYVTAYLAYRVESGLMEERKMLPFALIFVAVIFLSVALYFVYIEKKCKIK